MKIFKYRIKNKDIVEVKRRRYARLIVTRALKIGALQKCTTCELCKEKRNDMEAHHVDYGAPMRINWLCRKCHGLAHREGHELNPNRHPQTPMPASMAENEKVVVSTLVSIDTFLALQAASKAQGKPIAAIIREKILESHPIESKQFDLFEDRNDRTQDEPVKRIRRLAKDEELLPQQEVSILSQVRGKGRQDLRRVEQQLLPIFDRYGSDASRMQRAYSA